MRSKRPRDQRGQEIKEAKRPEDQEIKERPREQALLFSFFTSHAKVDMYMRHTVLLPTANL